MRAAVILSKQRSGTTALRMALGTMPGVRDWGEVFHHVRGPQDDPNYERFHIHPEAGFFTFREALFRQSPEVSFPTEAHQLEVWQRYLSMVESLAPQALHLFDIKYNSAHHLDPIYHSQFEAPLLLTALARDGCPVVHLVRRDLLAQALSLLRAQRTDVWHRAARDTAPVDRAEMVVDPEYVFWTMEVARWEIERQTGYLQSHPRVMSLDYESLYRNDGSFAPDVLGVMVEFLGMTPVSPPVRPPMARMPHRLFDGVSNRDAILEYLASTRYADLVAAHRSQIPDRGMPPAEGATDSLGPRHSS
ncbi:MAG: Stf0 sulfotransferase family protein [Acidobacteriota bacterium]|nr:Stf0 sulfotransferase family protein [Acidobacteriota bacterium]